MPSTCHICTFCTQFVLRMYAPYTVDINVIYSNNNLFVLHLHDGLAFSHFSPVDMLFIQCLRWEKLLNRDKANDFQVTLNLW